MQRHQDLEYISNQAQKMFDLEIVQCNQCEDDFALDKNMFTNHSWDNAINHGMCEKCDVTTIMQQEMM